MVAGERPDHRAPRGARSPRSVDEQQRRRLPRAVVDHVHPMRVLNVVLTHTEDDAWAGDHQSWTNVVVEFTTPAPPSEHDTAVPGPIVPLAGSGQPSVVP